jgi:hypothetical protein
MPAAFGGIPAAVPARRRRQGERLLQKAGEYAMMKAEDGRDLQNMPDPAFRRGSGIIQEES